MVPGQEAWEGVKDLLGESYLPPRLRAQLFDFLAEVPGTSVDDNATDATGRPGIAVAVAVAVAKTMDKVRHELVFDRHTYRFLGSREVFLGPEPHITDWREQPPGSNFDLAFTVLETKVVNTTPPITTRH